MSTTLEHLVEEAGGLDALPEPQGKREAAPRRRGRPRKIPSDGLDVKTRLEPLVGKKFLKLVKERNISVRDGLREAVQRYVAASDG